MVYLCVKDPLRGVQTEVVQRVRNSLRAPSIRSHCQCVPQTSPVDFGDGWD